MHDEPLQQPSEERQVESALLKLQKALHHCLHECLECRREIASHWLCDSHHEILGVKKRCGASPRTRRPRFSQIPSSITG